jgi:hypothetical protein
VLIQLDDHALVNNLCAHYTRSGFTAQPVGGGMIEITRPDSPTEDQHRREVVLHLQVWNVLNPDATARTVG